MYNPVHQHTFYKNKPITIITSSTLALFIILQFGYGIDLGFTKCLNKNIQRVAKCFSICISICIVVLLTIPLIMSPNEVYLWIFLLQYLLCVSVLYLSKFTFYDFIKDISLINNNASEFKSNIMGIACLVYSCVTFFIKLFVLAYYCKTCFEVPILPNYLYDVACLGSELISIVFVLIYYYLYCCIKKIKQLVIDSQISTKDTYNYYEKVADCYDKVIPMYDRLLTVELIFETPKLLLCVYGILIFIKAEARFYNIITPASYAIHALIRIIAPATVTEIVKCELENIKLILHNHLLVETDKKNSEEILNMLRYMEVRRVDHKIWRIIPIDLKLPLNLISMCITFIIVTVQFSHFYD